MNTQSNASLFNSFGTWNKLASDMCERITKQQMEFIGENVNRYSHQLQRLSHVTQPEEFINLQKEFVETNTSAAIKNLQSLIETSIENINEITSCCEKATCSMEKGKKTKKSKK